MKHSARPPPPARPSHPLRLRLVRFALGTVLFVLKLDMQLALPRGRRHERLLHLADRLAGCLRNVG